jgi:transposase
MARAWQLDIAAPGSGFIPALVVPEPGSMASSPPEAGRMEVVSANDRRVIVDRDVDVEALLRVMRAVETFR